MVEFKLCSSCCSGEKKANRNPFLPYGEALWVGHLSQTHTLLLNKFNVVAHHLICVTREFEQQTQPLTAADLEATWAAMQVTFQSTEAEDITYRLSLHTTVLRQHASRGNLITA